MKAIGPAAAIFAILLIVPAMLFMTALFLRDVQPLLGTGQLVDWFSHHVLIGLDIFLVAMPLAAIVVGCNVLRRGWRLDSTLRRDASAIFAIARANIAPVAVAISTVMAAGILAMVAMHMITE